MNRRCDVDSPTSGRLRTGAPGTALLGLLLAFAAGPTRGQEPPAADEAPPAPELVQFFEAKVRPLLVEHCTKCHGAEKQKGKLRLDTRAGLRAGGVSGEVVVPGRPDESLLVQAVHYDGLEMPPAGKLPAAAVETLTDWVRRGAPWPAEPEGGAVRKPAREGITDEDRRHWAFQPVRRPEPPATPPGRPAAAPIDAFLGARLDAEGIEPNGPASPAELVRRLCFDLTGLPPTPEERERWARQVAGPEPGSFDEAGYAALVDELLERPAYGEHWGRHWLDVVRFAQSNGYERDGAKPLAWKYRDYVVEAFRDDTPYDRFLMEQLAGDELPDASDRTRIATGFYRLGVWDDEPDDKRQAEFDELDDTMVALGASFLGLTTGCARCHDHKFDPIPQRDYYRLLANLRGVRPYGPPEPNLDSPVFVPLGDPAAIRAAVADAQRRRAEFEAKVAAAPDDAAREKVRQQGYDKALAGLAFALGVKEAPGTPPPTHVLTRGNAGTPGAEVAPGFLSVLEPPGLAETADPAASGSESPLADLFPSSGRRLRLARWLARPEHPLTARVLVNRVWHYHFGRGIVASTADFGRAGTPPSHPELLDWLAADFVAHGWSIKHLHRRIVTSDAYRRSSRVDAELPRVRRALERDPGNVTLWRQNLKRLDAESIRDAMLAVSGELNRAVGGPEMFPKLSGEVLAGQSRPGLDWQPTTSEQECRRSLYAVVKRSVREPLLEAFDYSNTTAPLPERPVTTVAPQALILLNGRFTAARSAALADRAAAAGPDSDARIDALYRAVLQRGPDDRERAVARSYLADTASQYRALTGQLTFRPDVPAALSTGYRQAIAPEDCLLGPDRGWSYHRGAWGGGYEGIDSVDRRVGPFALWQGPEFREAEVRGRLRVENATEIVTLIVRGAARGDVWSGVAVTIDRRAGTVEIRQRSGDQEAGTKVPLIVPHQTWLPFRLVLRDGRLQGWFGDVATAEPTVSHALDPAQDAPGRLGVASWGGPVAFDGLELVLADRTLDVARTPTTRPVAGLPAGWSRFGGGWTPGGDGTIRVQPDAGAKILWDAQPVLDGEVSVALRMTAGRAAIGGLLLRVSDPKVGADNWNGYEVSLDLPNRRVILGDHRQNFTLRRAEPVDVRPDTWHTLRVVLAGRRVEVYVDGASTPQIREELEAPLTGTLAGLRTWNSEIAFRDLVVTRDGVAHAAGWSAPAVVVAPAVASDDAWADRQALEALGRSLLNLNEFVYID